MTSTWALVRLRQRAVDAGDVDGEGGERADADRPADHQPGAHPVDEDGADRGQQDRGR